MQTAILFVALSCSALGAGGAYTTFFSLSPAGVTAAAWLREMKHAIPRIGVPLFVVQPLAALTTVASAILARQQLPAFWFFVVAFASIALAGIITRTVHIPIDVRLKALNEDALPERFDEVQRRWWRFHVVRTAALLLGLVMLILGTLTRTS
jgi:hypothetical protein